MDPTELHTRIRLATKSDTPIILKLIHELAVFEKLTHLFEATEESLSSTLFNSSRPPFTSFTVFLLEASPTPLHPLSDDPLHSKTFQLSDAITDPDDVDEGGPRVIGYVLFTPNYAPFLAKPGFYVEHIYVREAYRGLGLGKMLMKAVTTKAVQLGFGRVDWVVLDWNVDAIKFYEKIGADFIKEYRFCRLAGDALLSNGSDQFP